VLWVGAATKDTGFSLTKLTFQVTHATDPDANAEREYIINQLSKRGVIKNVTFYKAGDRLPTENTHYITDGEVAVARLVGSGWRQRREPDQVEEQYLPPERTSDGLGKFGSTTSAASSISLPPLPGARV
jgi:hypothetical protein